MLLFAMNGPCMFDVSFPRHCERSPWVRLPASFGNPTAGGQTWSAPPRFHWEWRVRRESKSDLDHIFPLVLPFLPTVPTEISFEEAQNQTPS